MFFIKLFEVKGVKVICIREFDFYKVIKSLLFFCCLGFEKGVKDFKIIKSIFFFYCVNF